MKPVTTDLDYRVCLRDHYEARKEDTGFFSYRYMSQKLDTPRRILFGLPRRWAVVIR